MAEAKVSGKELGDVLDMHERSIRRYAKAGVIIKVGYGKYALAESVRNYVGVLRQGGEGALVLARRSKPRCSQG